MAAPKAIKLPRVRLESTPSSMVVNSVTDLPKGVILTGAEKLRQDGLTGKGIRVAVIDSGVDADHPGFNGQVTKQFWFRGGPLEGEDNHGTHVAGTIHMMAPEAEIYDYRVFGSNGDWEVDKAIVTCIYQAVFDKCKVINMSLGEAYPTADMHTAVKYANSKGVIVVCAAGNEGDGDPLTNERSFPAMWDQTISIAAVSKKQNLPVVNFSNSNPLVDYAGIGLNVTSFKPGGGFFTISGTSMACPHVAGLIAALLSGDSDFGKNKEVKRNLCKLLNDKYLMDIGQPGRDNESGLGFLTYLDATEFNLAFRN
eukprot:CAMPEP_0198264100 /NCGR_PEP_ID=MMETSP1447-20131203/14840_1 /TAXON_ID=420782 /ORGANISM="Chaetoceros dichaeta, Strain CCMP1751" /LENGTH=310 /DNA_ID=CAMNT_0043952941 /DNA_START=52 /DNA_END=984 /DNA_ORIENTATION=+